MVQQRVKVVFNLANRRGKLRRETLEGRTHLVVPCTMLVEGVVNGSGGPLYYPDDEIGKDPWAWNHMPVVVYHPKKDGELISARHPDVINTSKIGLLLNTAHGSKKLQTEVWLDEEKTKEVDQRVYEAVVNEQPMEVSTGLGLEVEETKGEFNNTKYEGVARNFRPDHLAILPDQRGACSIADGAGLFANSAAEPVKEGEPWVGNTAGKAVANADVSLQQQMSMVSQALRSKFASAQPGYTWNGYVEDIFDGYCVYCVYDKDYNSNLYSINYKVTDGNVEFTGDPVAVTRVVQYQKDSGGGVVGNSSSWQFVSISAPVSPKESSMFDKKAHIASLIGNGWKEEDRTFLESLSDDKLQKIVPKATPAPATTPEPTTVANAAVAAAPVPAGLTPDQQRMFQRLIANEQRMKGGLIQQIINAQAALGVPENKRFTDKFLANKELEELEGWVATLTAQQQAAQDFTNGMFQNNGNPAPYYGGAAGGPPVVGNANNSPFVCNEEPPVMPQLDFSDHNPNRK